MDDVQERRKNEDDVIYFHVLREKLEEEEEECRGRTTKSHHFGEEEDLFFFFFVSYCNLITRTFPSCIIIDKKKSDHHPHHDWIEHIFAPFGTYGCREFAVGNLGTR